MEHTHYHLILVDALYHLEPLGRRLETFIDTVADQALIRAQWEEAEPRITLVNFYNTTYVTLYENLEPRAAKASEKARFAREDIYDHPSAGLLTLADSLEALSREAAYGDYVSIYMVDEGGDSQAGVDLTHLCHSLAQARAKGWEIGFYRIDPAYGVVSREPSWLFMLTLDKAAMTRVVELEKTLQCPPPAPEPEREPDGPVAERLSLRELDTWDAFTLGGVAYNDFHEFSPAAEGTDVVRLGRGFDFHVNAAGQGLLSYIRLYPCSDSYDFANEDRCHHNYWLCRDEEEARRKMDYILRNLPCINNDYSLAPMPVWLGPALFFDDGTGRLVIGE